MAWMKQLAFGAVVAVAMVGGCQKQSGRPAGEVAFQDVFVPPDPAMRARDWEPTVVEYASGDVVAGPTLFPYEPSRTLAPWQDALVAPPLFIGQAVAAPVLALLVPVWGDVRYEGVDTPPLHTAMPPLPPTDPALFEVLRAQHEAAIIRQDLLNEELIARQTEIRTRRAVEEVTEPSPADPTRVDPLRSDPIRIEPDMRDPVRIAPTPPAPARTTPAPATRPAPVAPRETPAVVTPPPPARPSQTPTTRPAPRTVTPAPTTRPAATTRPAELNK